MLLNYSLEVEAMLGQKLRELRMQRKLSQSAVAKQLNISRQSYNFYENNKRQPDLYLVKLLAQFFHVSTDYLLDHDLSDTKPFPREPGDEFTRNLLQTIATLPPEDKKELNLFAQFLIYTRTLPGVPPPVPGKRAKASS